MSAPSFSGIPERPKPPKATSDQWDQGGLDASSSSKAAPVFSSFPARPTTKKNEDKDRRRERVRSRSPHADGERRKHKSDRHVRDKEEGSHKSRKSSKGAERDEERDRARRYEKEQDEERRRRKARRLDEAGESGKAKGRAVEKDITDDSKVREIPSKLMYILKSVILQLDKESETQKSFYVDRTGDEGNIRYGGIEPGKIPKYSTRGCKFILLMSPPFKGGLMLLVQRRQGCRSSGTVFRCSNWKMERGTGKRNSHHRQDASRGERIPRYGLGSR
jgi:hypothetical protein